jgi:hypothetical protein
MKKWLLWLLLLVSLATSVSAMDIKVLGHTMILSGAVTGDEWGKVKDAFVANPNINLAILRNSYGGDAWTGYRVGELFRERGITTAVSGYCISSCSRMFLGGKRRLFTDDYSAKNTYIGFHGHYNNGLLNARSVAEMGLYNWIMKYSDGRADPDLVRQWVGIELANGMVAFMHPDVSDVLGATVYACTGREQIRPLGCEKLKTNAIDRGVMTDTALVSSPDKSELPFAVRARRYPSSSFAQIDDISKVPLEPVAGIENYKRFRSANTPKAFAVSPTKQHWAWNSGEEGANELALGRCAERAKQTCVLYAVDDAVVFKP